MAAMATAAVSSGSNSSTRAKAASSRVKRTRPRNCGGRSTNQLSRAAGSARAASSCAVAAESWSSAGASAAQVRTATSGSVRNWRGAAPSVPSASTSAAFSSRWPARWAAASNWTASGARRSASWGSAASRLAACAARTRTRGSPSVRQDVTALSSAGAAARRSRVTRFCSASISSLICCSQGIRPLDGRGSPRPGAAARATVHQPGHAHRVLRRAAARARQRPGPEQPRRPGSCWSPAHSRGW